MSKLAKCYLPAIGLMLIVGPACLSAQMRYDSYLKNLKLPTGFTIAIFAQNLPDARSMTMSPNGTLYVGTRKEGRVYAIVDRDKDQRADGVFTIADGLNMPNGVAFRDDSLYVAEGWLQGNRAWGRPVDIFVMKDGALLVSDDRAGVIYRITYRGE